MALAYCRCGHIKAVIYFIAECNISLSVWDEDLFSAYNVEVHIVLALYTQAAFWSINTAPVKCLICFSSSC